MGEVYGYQISRKDWGYTYITGGGGYVSENSRSVLYYHLIQYIMLTCIVKIIEMLIGSAQIAIFTLIATS